MHSSARTMLRHAHSAATMAVARTHTAGRAGALAQLVAPAPRSAAMQINARTITTTRMRAAAPITPAPAATPAAAVADGAAAAAAASSAAAAVVPPATAAAAQASRLDRLRRLLERNQVKIINFSVAGGLAYGVYAVYSFGWDLIDFFLEQRALDAPYLSFITGALCTLGGLALYRVGRRLFVLNSARSYRTLLRSLFQSPDVQTALGDDVRAKTIARMQRYGRNHTWERVGAQAATGAGAGASALAPPPANGLVAPHYRRVCYLPAGFCYRGAKDGWSRYWRSRRLQFSLHLVGSRSSGLVSAEVEAPLRGEFDHTNLLVVDLLERGEVVVVQRADQRKRKQDLLDVSDQSKGVSRDGSDLLSEKIVKA